MENLMENMQDVTKDTAVAVTETIVEKAPSFLEKHGKNIAGGIVCAVAGAMSAIGITRLAGKIKTKLTERKARKAAATATEQPAPEVPETPAEE